MWSQLLYRTAAGQCDYDNKGRFLRFKFQTLPSLYAAFSILVRFQPVWQLGFFGARSKDPQWSPITEIINFKWITHVYWVSFLFGSVLGNFSRAVNRFLFKICILPPEVVVPLAPCPPSYTPCYILFITNSDFITCDFITYRLGLPINRELPEGVPDGTVTEIWASWQPHNKHNNKFITRPN
jgi:hypothetical protein